MSNKKSTWNTDIIELPYPSFPKILENFLEEKMKLLWNQWNLLINNNNYYTILKKK